MKGLPPQPVSPKGFVVRAMAFLGGVVAASIVVAREFSLGLQCGWVAGFGVSPGISVLHQFRHQFSLGVHSNNNEFLCMPSLNKPKRPKV